MSLHENTLSELIVRLLRVPLQSYKGGTCTTATSTTSFKDAARKEPDDYFQSTTPVSWIHIISTTDGAAPVNESAQISDFANTDGAITYAPATTAVAVGDKYVILSEYNMDEIKEAINTAIDIATSNSILTEKIDENLLIQDDTYEYNIPTGFTHIYRISQANGSGEYPDPIPPSHYKIIRGGAIPRIHFYRFPVEAQHSGIWYNDLWVSTDLDDGKALRIEGFARQPKLEMMGDVCRIDPNFVVWQAAALLHGARIIQTASDFDNNRVRAEYCEGKAREFLADAKKNSQMPPNIKRVAR